MGLFEQFPYTNLHNLNLDWLINAIKELGNNAVLSVNGQTGDVILYQSENIVFPEVEADTWRMVRIADGHTAGVMFQNGLMYVMFDNASERVYTVEHPPTFPVTSVNGQTGAVELYQDAGVRLPNVTDDYTNVRRQIQTNGVDNIVGIEVKADKAYRMKDAQRVEIYDAMNQPPYPVSSVNGQTGAVMLAIPFANVNVDDVMFTNAATGHEWSIGRETQDGTASIQIRTDSTKAEAWIDFFTDDSPQVTYSRKLLTIDDIPSGSGVVSINGLTGVVTITGSDIKRNANSLESISTALDNLDTEVLSQGGDITDLQDDMLDAQGDITALQTAVSGLSGGADGLAFIVTGDSASAAVPAGEYVYIKNNTHSLADGYYQNTSGSTFPASGGTADSTVFTAVSGEGVLNELNDHNNELYLRADSTLTNIPIPSPQANFSYTATDDCLLMVRSTSANSAVFEVGYGTLATIDNNEVIYLNYNPTATELQTTGLIPLKKGVTISFVSSDWSKGKLVKLTKFT